MPHPNCLLCDIARASHMVSENAMSYLAAYWEYAEVA